MSEVASESSICRTPAPTEIIADRTFRKATFLFALLTILAVLFLIGQTAYVASPAVKKYGLGFITGEKWDGKENFGILPEIWGTLYSSILGVFMGSIFGIAIAIFLTQDFIPHRLELVCKNIIELLAAIPSVVYGLWGIFVVIPFIRPMTEWIHSYLGWIPIFGTRLSGPGLLPAAIVLAIMVLPTITAISRNALAAVPPKLREAAFGLGATRWETILAVVLPTAKRGVYGAIILAFGRALGETMALAMLVGNSNTISASMFAPASTLAAMIANRFAEASKVEMSLLMYAALVLMTITLLVNVVGTWILQGGVLAKGLRK
jgi:phosphate transport system permease protein